MAQRTDHTVRIEEMRAAADSYEISHNATGSIMTHDLYIDLRAAADLLELHDSTGLNLHNAPNLLAFVEYHMNGKVDPNGA